MQCKLKTEHSDSLRSELERIKTKLSKIVSVKTRGTTIIRSGARWYEHGEKNSKYFYNLEKTNQRKKHVTSLKINDYAKLADPKEILEEEERFFKQLYTSKNTNPNGSEWVSCHGSAGRVTLSGGTTFSHINTLARLPEAR